MYLPGSKCTTTTLEAPGPGNYEIKTLVGTAKKFSMYQKVKPVLPSAVETPPPNSYHLNFNLSEPHKFSAITFGFGNRCNVNGCKLFVNKFDV